MRFLAIALLAAACAAPVPPPGAAGPAEAVQAFAAALQKGDTATAWSLLSTSSQKAADDLARKSGAPSGKEMLFGSALPGGPVVAHALSEKGDEAEVRTTAPDGGAPKTFHAVKENARWRVDLALGR